MSNKPATNKIIAHIAGTNPKSSSIFDYFHSSKSISYSVSNPTLVIVFKSNIYVELKSIAITNNATNVLEYKIDLIDYDRTILQTIMMSKQSQQPNISFYVPIGALQITYLKTIDGQSPRNIKLSIDGCFGINPFPVISTAPTTTLKTTTRKCRFIYYTKEKIRYPYHSIILDHCHEIDMMNKVDSTILVDSIAGTLPITKTNKLIDYFNQSSLISYDNDQLPITFLIKFKSNIHAEITSISLISPTTNVEKFQVDLIDDYKSILQTIPSSKDLTVEGLTEIGIAAIRITYIQTSDNKSPKNIRLSIKGCFGVLPNRRRTTPPMTTASTLSTSTTPASTRTTSRTTQRIQSKIS